MDGQELVGSNWATLVDWLTDHVDDSAESLGADGHLNGITSVLDWLATDETLSGVEGNRAHVVATQVLGDLEDETVLGALDLESVENGREFALELDVDDSTNDLGNLSRGAAEATYIAGTVSSYNYEWREHVLMSELTYAGKQAWTAFVTRSYEIIIIN